MFSLGKADAQAQCTWGFTRAVGRRRIARVCVSAPRSGSQPIGALRNDSPSSHVALTHSHPALPQENAEFVRSVPGLRSVYNDCTKCLYARGYPGEVFLKSPTEALWYTCWLRQMVVSPHPPPAFNGAPIQDGSIASSHRRLYLYKVPATAQPARAYFSNSNSLI